jgi:hypothetical protein
MLASFWTTVMFAVGFAGSGDSNRALPLGYYAYLLGGLLLAGAVAFWIARRSGRRVDRSLLTVLYVVVASLFTPYAVIGAVIVASNTGVI